MISQKTWTLAVVFCMFGNLGLSQSMDIFQALHHSDQSVLASAIGQSADVNARNANGDTALLVASRSGDLWAIELLVESGADINALDAQRRDVLNIAITTENPKLAELALSLGANPKSVTSIYDGGALIYGSAKGAVEIVAMLIDAGAPVDRVNNLGWTALLEVAILGDGSKSYVDIAQMLIGAGADPRVKDREGLSAYDHAKKRGHSALANVLAYSN